MQGMFPPTPNFPAFYLTFLLANPDNRIAPTVWNEMKDSMRYGQVPVVDVDGKEMAQSNAILRWVATLGDGSLYPADKMFKVEEAMGVLEDYMRVWSPCLYQAMKPEMFGRTAEWPKTEEGVATIKALREKFVADELPKFVKFLERLLEDSGGPFLCGTTPTIADMAWVPILRALRGGFLDHVPSTCLDQYATITSYLEAFYALPALVPYYAAKNKK